MEDRKRRTRGADRPDLMGAEETVTVTSVYAGDDSREQKRMRVRKFVTEPAYVRVNAGMTKNMGNYESLRVDVSISVPCYPEEIDGAFKRTADRVAALLEDELKQYEGK